MFIKKEKIKQFINKQKTQFQKKLDSIFDMPAALFPDFNRNKISKIMQMKVAWLEFFLLDAENLDFDKLVKELMEILELEALVLFKLSNKSTEIISFSPDNFNLEIFTKLNTRWLKNKKPENFILKSINLESLNIYNQNGTSAGKSIRISFIPIKVENTIKGGFFLVHGSNYPLQFGNFDLSQVRDFALYLSKII